MTDITLPIIAGVFVLAFLVRWYLDTRPDTEKILREYAERGVALAQDKKLQGIFGTAQGKGEQALQDAIIYVRNRAHSAGYEFSLDEVAEACRVAYIYLTSGK